MAALSPGRPIRLIEATLLGACLAFTWLLTASGHPTPGTVDLKVMPSQSTVTVGETFTMTIVVEAGPQLVSGAQVYLDYEPGFIRVKKTPATTPLFENLWWNEYDNLNGWINYAADTAVKPEPSGNFTALTIQFEALVPIEITSLSFSTNTPRKTVVTYGGVSILGSLTGGTIKVLELKKLFLPLLIR